MSNSTKPDEREIPVSARTDTFDLGHAIAEHYKQHPQSKLCLTAMGMVCIEKAVKGVMNANTHLSIHGVFLVIHPGLEDRPMVRDQTVKTVTKLMLFKMSVQPP